jgi:hypothetical protein
VIETELFFQLLVRLLVNPSCLDGGGQGAQRRLRRQVGEIVFRLFRQPVISDASLAALACGVGAPADAASDKPVRTFTSS